MSYGDQLNVNFGVLMNTSSHIASTIRSLDSQLDELERAAAPLVATWSGAAKQAYQERQNTWRQASAELTVMLQSIKRALDDTIADFQNTERSNTNLFLSGRG